MAARIPLGKLLAAGSNGPSVHIRLDDPPFTFDAPATNSLGVAWAGSILIQNSIDTVPDPQGPNAAGPGGTLPAGAGVLDANARWETIATVTPASGPQSYGNPLTRVRANCTGVTSGAPDVYLLAGIRSLNKDSRPTQTRTANRG